MKLRNKFKMFYKINKNLILVLFFIFLFMPVEILYAENVLIQADKQVFDGEKTVFEGNVRVNYEDIFIKSPRAIVRNDKNGKIGTATFVDRAYALKESGYSRSEVKADIINLSLLKNRLQAKGNAESAIFENKVPLVHIKAGSQIFDIKKNIIVAEKNVKIKYKDIKTSSNKARISINSNGNLDKVELLDKVRVDHGKNIIKADEVLYLPATDEIIASGNAKSETILDDDSKIIILADFQQYDQFSKTFITSGHVKIKYKDYIVTGPKATFISDKTTGIPNKIIFLGRSRIQEMQRYVEADRIEITINPKNFKAEGNVKTRFSQVESYKNLNKMD